MPTKGPMRSIDQEGPAAATGGIRIEALPPRPGVDMVPLVNGFLEAMSDSRAFDVARQYLTPEAAGSWKPEAGTLVYDQSSATTVAVGADGKVHLKAPRIATIDARGSWTPAPQGAPPLDWTFNITEVSGQKRISNVPRGVFLGSNQLDPRLNLSTLYFLNQSKDLLVPDPVWLPRNVTPGQAATQIIQELLKGPTNRLGQGVVSAAPPGTTVNVSVPIDLGVASVSLSDTAASLTEPLDRERLAAQITWTLRLITNRVRITVDGAPLLPDQPEVLSFTNFSQYDPSVQDGRLNDLYGVYNKKIQRIEGQNGAQDIEPKPLNDSLLYQYDAHSFAVNLRGELGAVVSEKPNGTPIVVVARLDSAVGPDSKESVIAAQGKVLRPTFDDNDNLWILDRADSGKPRLRVRAKDGKVTEVATKFGQLRPVSLRMAPDGVRALLVVEHKNVTSVLTGTIEPTKDKKLSLGRLKALPLPLTDITDASWNNGGIVVAGKSTSGTDGARPWQVNADGSQPRPVPGGSSEFEVKFLASNPNLDTLLAVQDTQGQLHWQGKDLIWVSMSDGPSGPKITPVYPG